MTSRAGRIDLIDTLRGAALLGILLVNVQSFTWGAGNPLGYFDAQAPSVLDQGTYALLAVFVAGKFYPIFAFLFGAGFALQLRALRERCGSRPAARALYRRRLQFLLAAGIVHGTLLYFGDVLTAYAVCAYMLLHYADARPSRLARAALRWWVASLVLSLLWLCFAASVPAEQPADVPAALTASREIYLLAGYPGQLATRANDYLTQNVFSAPIFWPQIIAIFLVGTLAGRLGWLRAPQRHARVWRNAARIGLLVGLPCAIAAGLLNTLSIRDAPGDLSVAESWLAGIGSLLAAAYVAAFVRLRTAAWLQRPFGWLALAGRMPLTNYVAQSFIMGALLSGWGAGLGAQLDHAGASVLALAIYALQIVLARFVIARYGLGPLEALWRRWTYRGLSPAVRTLH